MTNPRNCATGRRPLSGHYANKHPDTCEKCPECGYWHEIPANAPVAGNPPFDHSAPMPDGIKYAKDVRPMDKILIDGEYKAVLGFEHKDDVAIFEVAGQLAPYTVAQNAPVRLLQGKVNQRAEELLAMGKAVRETSKAERQASAAGDDWGLQVFDWMEGAIRMLKNREWAEQMPLGNAMLCDLETQISELVGLSTRYTEVQHKFAAAVRTLESLGYEYRSEGAELWAPPRGEAPNYIQWEQGAICGLPPVGAQITYEYPNGNRVNNGRVLGVSSQYMIVARYTGDEGETEEEVVEISEVKITPYSHSHHQRAEELVAELKRQGHRLNNTATYALVLTLIKAGKI